MKNHYDDLEFEEPFNLNEDHTPRELDEIADMILRADVRAGNKIHNDNPILFYEHLRTRYKREIYNKEGIPDPSIQQGLYNRTHPEGRKVNSEKARKESGASFYRAYCFLPEAEYLMGKEMLEAQIEKGSLR